jgi:hypothetical protein
VCSDFDGVVPGQALFTPTPAPPVHGAAVVSNAQAFSPPNGLVVDVGDVPSAAFARAAYSHRFDGAPTGEVRCELRWRVSTAPPMPWTDDMDLLVIELMTGADPYVYSLVQSADRTVSVRRLGRGRMRSV